MTVLSSSISDLVFFLLLRYMLLKHYTELAAASLLVARRTLANKYVGYAWNATLTNFSGCLLIFSVLPLPYPLTLPHFTTYSFDRCLPQVIVKKNWINIVHHFWNRSWHVQSLLPWYANMLAFNIILYQKSKSYFINDKIKNRFQ